MDKTKILESFNKIVEDERKQQDAYDLMAKGLKQHYIACLNHGFSERQSFLLTQQYYERIMEKFL
jgi:hypothetical protein